jgi:hypothetical protein
MGRQVAQQSNRITPVIFSRIPIVDHHWGRRGVDQRPNFLDGCHPPYSPFASSRNLPQRRVEFLVRRDDDEAKTQIIIRRRAGPTCQRIAP